MYLTIALLKNNPRGMFYSRLYSNHVDWSIHRKCSRPYKSGITFSIPRLLNHPGRPQYSNISVGVYIGTRLLVLSDPHDNFTWIPFVLMLPSAYFEEALLEPLYHMGYGHTIGLLKEPNKSPIASR